MSLLGEAVEYLPVAVFVFDDEGRYVAVNDYASQLLGYPREELVKLHLGELAESPREAVAAYEAVAEGREKEGRARVRRKDGSVVELRFRGGSASIGGMPFYVGVAWKDD
jgi:PAS domain S-box-containing protein